MEPVIRTRSTGDRARFGLRCWVVIAALLAGLLALASAPAAARAQITSTASATTLRLGSRGADVRALQSTLARLSYLTNGAVDGVFGMRTWHAVVAFQGWSAISRDGIVGRQTRAALTRARRPTPWSTSTGFEIHITQQVLCLYAMGGSSARFTSRPERAERRHPVTSGSTGVKS